MNRHGKIYNKWKYDTYTKPLWFLYLMRLFYWKYRAVYLNKKLIAIVKI